MRRALHPPQPNRVLFLSGLSRLGQNVLTLEEHRRLPGDHRTKNSLLIVLAIIGTSLSAYLYELESNEDEDIWRIFTITSSIPNPEMMGK
jgi:hypothetical protein